ncbi:MAG: DUF3179 domain-containing (seleno)protein [Nitrospinota bacterium]
MTRISGVFWVALFFAALAPFAVAVVGPASANPADEIRTLLPKDGIPSIDDPKFATVREADRFMSSDEMVIGVNINGERRAYSVPLLGSHEIVNDVGGGNCRHLVTLLLYGHRV